MRQPRGWALPALATLWLLGCGQQAGPSLIRLVEIADASVVADSPLLAPPAVGPAVSTLAWSTDFSGDALADLGWPDWGRSSASAWVDEASDGERVVCVGSDADEVFSIAIPARSLTRYRLSRRLKTDWAGFDLRIVESSMKVPRQSGRAQGLAGRSQRAHQTIRSLVAKAATLAVHRFPPAEAGRWSEAQVDFVTSLDTRTLVVGFERVGDASRPLNAGACFAEVVVERFEPDVEQDLNLVRSAWLRSDDTGYDAVEAGEDAVLGLVKRGRLLPMRRLKASQPPYDENYGVRDALFAPAPTRLRFALTLPLAPRFSFAYGLAAGSRIGDEVEFEVSVERQGMSESVFRRTATIGRGGRGWHWQEAKVDLARWEGETVVLELRTTSSTPRGFGLWADPVIDAPRARADPPNVILIGVDTLRADRLSAYGHDRPTSPNLDRLAADGVRFARAISASNWTAPSFASIFTGLPAASHGVVNEEFEMAGVVETLAERLQSAGWRTHAVAYKAALFGLGLDQGFDRWLNLPTSNRTAQTNLDKALAVLERDGDRRFFLFLHLDDPHQPFNQPAPFDRTFADPEARRHLDFELPISIRNAAVGGCERCMANGRPTPEFVAEAQALYDAAVAYTDDRIGALIDDLHRRGLYDDTVIAVVADHGEVLYDRFGLWGHGAVHLADEMVHVPLIIKPAGEPRGRGEVVEAQVRTTDLVPTLLESVGLSGGEGPDAESLWPLIDGGDPEARVVAKQVAFFENPQRDVVGLRTPQWKYVLRTHGGRTYAQLYDLLADPGESDNLAGGRPETVARLNEVLARFLLRTREGPFLLVVDDGNPGTRRLGIAGVEPSEQRSLLGLLPAPAGDSRDLSVAGGGKVLALLQLDLAAGRTVEATLSTGGRPLFEVEVEGADVARYDPAHWERLLATPGIYLLRGPEQAGAKRVGRPTNVDQVEDLRALGYID